MKRCLCFCLLLIDWLIGSRCWSCCLSLIDWSSLGSSPVVLCLAVLLRGTRFHPNCLSWRRASISWSGWEHTHQSSGTHGSVYLSTYVSDHLVLQANEDGAEIFPDSSALQLAPYGNYYQSLGTDESLRRTYELLACFKKDMHKVRKKRGDDDDDDEVMMSWCCHDICFTGGDLPDGGKM